MAPRLAGASTSCPAIAAALCSAVRIMSPSKRSGFPTPMFSTHQKEIEMRNLKRLLSNYSIFLSKSQNLKRVQEERQIKISGISDHLIEVKQTKKNSGRKSGSKVCCRRGIYPRWRLSLDQKHFNLAIKWSGKTVSPHNLNCIKKIRISVDACETVSNYSKVAAQKGKELLQGKF